MNTKEFYNESTNVIVFDPSIRCTGWLWYKPNEHKIKKYGCIRKAQLLHGKQFSGVMEERMAFQQAYSKALTDLLRWYDHETTFVVMEEPIGSQNVTAAWAMAMASMAVIAVSTALHRKSPITLREREAKEYYFNTNVVSKEQTMKHMWNYWYGQGIVPPKDTWITETRSTVFTAQKEAVADAMLLLNLFLHKISVNEITL